MNAGTVTKRKKGNFKGGGSEGPRIKICASQLNHLQLTGTPTARGLFVTFLPSRPLKWGFRTFFRSNLYLGEKTYVSKHLGNIILKH